MKPHSGDETMRASSARTGGPAARWAGGGSDRLATEVDRPPRLSPRQRAFRQAAHLLCRGGVAARHVGAETPGRQRRSAPENPSPPAGRWRLRHRPADHRADARGRLARSRSDKLVVTAARHQAPKRELTIPAPEYAVDHVARSSAKSNEVAQKKGAEGWGKALRAARSASSPPGLLAMWRVALLVPPASVWRFGERLSP
jgi:hypothetical protein